MKKGEIQNPRLVKVIFYLMDLVGSRSRFHRFLEGFSVEADVCVAGIEVKVSICRLAGV